MKKFILLLSVIFTVILVYKVYESQALTNRWNGHEVYSKHAGKFDVNWQACEEDSECIAVHNRFICCSSTVGINKEYQRDFEEYQKKNMKALDIVHSLEAKYYCQICAHKEMPDAQSSCSENKCIID